MDFKIGDKVTRNSYDNDIVFAITNIIDDTYYLKAINFRLYADSDLKDLKKYEDDIKEDEEYLKRIKAIKDLDRNDYFYLPGKILHIDGDKEYLDKCLKYYEEANIWAVGLLQNENEIKNNIINLLDEYNPNIVVITGHDAYYKRKGNKTDIKAYKNSDNFVQAVKQARKYEKSHEKLIIIAGACQSDYEELIKAGANFASSPKRINIHALDPAVIATKMSLSNVNEEIDIKKLLETTKYGKDGIGGIKTKGTMYVGYPR